jgi:hypothetical protein
MCPGSLSLLVGPCSGGAGAAGCGIGRLLLLGLHRSPGVGETAPGASSASRLGSDSGGVYEAPSWHRVAAAAAAVGGGGLRRR